MTPNLVARARSVTCRGAEPKVVQRSIAHADFIVVQRKCSRIGETYKVPHSSKFLISDTQTLSQLLHFFHLFNYLFCVITTNMSEQHQASNTPVTQATNLPPVSDSHQPCATSPTLSATTSKVLKPKKKSKKLCQYKSCTSPHSIIGDCQFCFKKFCGKHRLLESHDCEHYREVQKDYHDRNAKQLQAQQTIASKV